MRDAIQFFKWLRVKIVMWFVIQQQAIEEDTSYRPENEWPMR